MVYVWMPGCCLTGVLGSDITFNTLKHANPVQMYRFWSINFVWKRPQFIFQIFFPWVWYNPIWPIYGDLPRSIFFWEVTYPKRFDLGRSSKVGQMRVKPNSRKKHSFFKLGPLLIDITIIKYILPWLLSQSRIYISWVILKFYFFFFVILREVNRHSSLKRHGEHMLLKGYATSTC